MHRRRFFKVFTVQEQSIPTSFRVDTQGLNDVKLPLVSSGQFVDNSEFNFTVDWGDGNEEVVNTTAASPNITHTYASSGVYDITIKDGICVGFSTDSVSNLIWRTQLIDILQWGNTVKFINNRGTFRGCDNLTSITATDNPVLEGDIKEFFNECSFLTYNSTINNWDTSNVTDMSQMFYRTSNFDQPLNSWNVSSVTGMSRMFREASAFNQPLNSWNVSSVTDMSEMFYNSDFPNTIKDTSFNQDLDNWNTGSVTNMEGMFASNRVFNGDITTWNTSNVTNMRIMFYQCEVFNQSIGFWNVSNVTDMDFMLLNSSFDQNLEFWSPTSLLTANAMLGTISITNYNSLLNGWSEKTLQNNVEFGASSSKYTVVGQSGRNVLTGTYNWTIIDGGLQ